MKALADMSQWKTPSDQTFVAGFSPAYPVFSYNSEDVPQLELVVIPCLQYRCPAHLSRQSLRWTSSSTTLQCTASPIRPGRRSLHLRCDDSVFINGGWVPLGVLLSGEMLRELGSAVVQLVLLEVAHHATMVERNKLFAAWTPSHMSTLQAALVKDMRLLPVSLCAIVFHGRDRIVQLLLEEGAEKFDCRLLVTRDNGFLVFLGFLDSFLVLGVCLVRLECCSRRPGHVV